MFSSWVIFLSWGNYSKLWFNLIEYYTQIYIYIYICMYIYISLYVHFMYSRANFEYVYSCACIRECSYVQTCLYTLICVCTCTFRYLCAFVCMCAHACIYMNVSDFVCSTSICVYMCRHIYFMCIRGYKLVYARLYQGKWVLVYLCTSKAVYMPFLRTCARVRGFRHIHIFAHICTCT